MQGVKMKLTRRAMISQTVGALTAAPGGVGRSVASINAQQTGNDFYLQLVKANDARVPNLIAAVDAAKPRRAPIRRLTSDLQGLAAAFCAPESAHFKAEKLIAPLEQAARHLLAAQHA